MANRLLEGLRAHAPAVFVFASVFTASNHTLANPVMSDYVAVPPLIIGTAPPQVMIALSNDHQLYFKAYTDYDDLDADGTPDNTYKSSIHYEGYFDAYKCYTYSTSSSRFEPSGLNDDDFYCNAGSTNNEWSGNFLNWVSMTRIDEIRKVLYGGYRSTDSSSMTVLERSFLPHDAHSFAKHYNGTDVEKLTPFNPSKQGLTTDEDSGVTFCNTSDGSGSSSTSTAPPLLKVAEGNFELWASNERWQCRWGVNSNANDSAASGIYAHSSSPTKSADGMDEMNGSSTYDYTVRVRVCVDGLIGNEDCKEYPTGTVSKPTGVLQEFGDDGSVLFGLMTGSYQKNKSGGVLRKNVSTIDDEINVDTNGTFIANAGGIIQNIDAFRIARYNFSNGTYRTSSFDDCNWGTSSFTEGDCSNWGNPFSEMVGECYRYFAGQSATSAFAANDSSYLSDLTTATWVDSVTTTYRCSSLNVIAFNASSSSYDSDQLGSMHTDLGSTDTVQTLTKTVGDGENITGNTYFVGENGTDNNQLCTAKTVNDLGLVQGTCPNAPRLDGGFGVAGLAHYAHTNDLRPSIDGEQNVDTYGVTLSPAVPNITITNNQGETVKILPACRNTNPSPDGNCAIVDFRIVQNPTEVSTNTFVAKFYVNWEDTEQGGDFDQDMWGVIDVKMDNNNVWVTTDVHKKSTPFKMGFGYVISGTTQDGFHVHQGINGFSYSDSVSAQEVTNYSSDPFSYSGGGTSGCSSCRDDQAGSTDESPATGRMYTIGTASAGLLEQPLYYAAKWGGFTDVDGDGKPLLDIEFDSRNNTTGDIGSDGIPDNFFFAVNPALLKDQLTLLLNNIISRVSSGSAAAVVANSSNGVGAVYQALYNPTKTGTGDRTVSWTGSLQALFVDDTGLMREDGNGNGRLDDYNTDNVVVLYFDDSLGETVFQRFNDSTAEADGEQVVLETNGSPEILSEIKPLWNAGDILALKNPVSGEYSDFSAQRTYSDVAQTGRYIFTWIDRDGDGVVDDDDTSSDDEVIDFVASNFPSDATAGEINENNFRYLGLDSGSKSESEKLVNFIRGVEQTDYRSRSLNIDGDSDPDGADALEVWRLGDIIHSSPVVVGAPRENYDGKFFDLTYRQFEQQYKNRRQMVYAGANDGMLHAFNGGVWDFDDKEFDLGTPAHKLGTEVWAYVPQTLLPHLQWLARSDYSHVYYVDGEPQVFDVNIFDDDADHPNGWGTILVVGMRLGGGDYQFDPDSDDNGSDSDNDDLTFKSAYVILDITNPDNPPEVLAEISPPGMGFSTSKPALIKSRVPSSTGGFSTPDKNEWKLVFGNGPDELDEGVSSQNSSVYVYDLVSRSFETLDSSLVSGATETASFYGNFNSVDWDDDFTDDVVYVGTTKDNGTNSFGGKLKRFVLADFVMSGVSVEAAIEDVLDVGLPFSSTPYTSVDARGERWVYAGTGRMLVRDDAENDEQQSFFGVKDPEERYGQPAYDKTDLIFTNDVGVLRDGTVYDSSFVSLASITEAAVEAGSLTPWSPAIGISIGDFTSLQSYMAEQAGWYIDLANEVTAGAQRVLNAPGRFSDSIVFTSYEPALDQCEPEGEGFLHALHMQTGSAAPFAPLGVIDQDGDGAYTETTDFVAAAEMSLGQGLPSAPVLHRSTEATPDFDDPVERYDRSGNELVTPTGSASLFCDTGGGETGAMIQTSTASTYRMTIAQQSGACGRTSWRRIYDW